MNKKAVMTAICALVLLVRVSSAAETTCKLSLNKDKTVPGRQVQLFLEVPAGMGVSPPKISYVEGLDIRFKETLENSPGEIGVVVFVYSVVPLKEGDFTIGPVGFVHNGRQYLSDAVGLSSGRGEPLQKQEIEVPGPSSPTDIFKEHIFMKVSVPRNEIFVNEEVPVTVKFYTDWLDIEGLEVGDAERSSDIIAARYEQGKTELEILGGVKYAVLTFGKRFFAPEAGNIVFGPVRAFFSIHKRKAELLNDNENAYNRILGRKDSIQTFLDSQTVDLTVLPLPAARPVDFTGAIGNFTFDVGAEPLHVKVGGKVTFTMEVKGDGNYNTVRSPLVEREEGISLSSATSEKSADGMIFRQEMTVTSPTVKELPRVRFIFFDPSKREYIVSAGGGDPIEVEGPPEDNAKEGEIAPDKIREESKAGLVRLKDGPGRFFRGDPVILQKGAITFVLTVPLCLIVGAMAVQKRAKKLESDKPYAAWLKASSRARRDLAELNRLIREGGQGDFYDKVFRTIQEYLGARLFTAPAGISDDVIEVLCASGGISGEETGKIKTLFDECHMARYAPLKFDVEDMKNTYSSLKEIIGALDGRRRL